MSQIEEITNQKPKTMKLIQGEFSPEDAFEVLSHLIGEKISFHERRSFSNLIRFGSADILSQTRIEELNETLEEVRSQIHEAHKTGKKLKVYSNITLELI